MRRTASEQRKSAKKTRLQSPSKMAIVFPVSIKTSPNSTHFFACTGARFPKEVDTWENIKHGILSAISAELKWLSLA